MDWLDNMIYWLKVAIAWIVVIIHKLLVAIGMPDGGGIAWVVAIIGLTIVIRSAVIPLYFKQILAQRNIQLIQPELKALREKYKGRKDPVSQQQQQQEIMALYRKHKANPFSSCWPMFVQIPVFLALFRVLASTGAVAAGTYMYPSIGPMDANIAKQIEESSFLGAPLSSSFMTAWQSGHKGIAGVCLVLVVLMALTMFFTQKMMMTKNMPQNSDPNDMQMRMMRTMTYTMPIVMGVTGVAFQVGVLLYWLTSNLFMYLQQTYTIHKMPAPGSDAHKKLIARHQEKYRLFREEAVSDLNKKLANIGVDEASANAAYNAFCTAQISGEENPREVLNDPNLPGVRYGFAPEILWQAVQLRQLHEEKLRVRRVKLQLEQKQDRREVELKNRAQVANKQRVQPQRLTRAERARLNDEAASGSANGSTIKPAKDRRMSREERRRAIKEGKPKR